MTATLTGNQEAETLSRSVNSETPLLIFTHLHTLKIRKSLIAHQVIKRDLSVEGHT